MGKKVLVIGIDGGSFDIIDLLVKRGKLKNLSRLMDNGCRGILQSTIPPITGPAWTTFQTGKNPGKHGVFDWLRRKNGEYNLEPISSFTFGDSKCFWDYLGDHGLKSCIINVPVTYPPKPLKGLLVTGLLTPRNDSNFTYPEELKNDPVFTDYTIDPEIMYNKNNKEKWQEALLAQTRKRTKVAKALFQKDDFAFNMVHFTTSDLVQHRMWHTLGQMDDNNIMKNVYIEIDRSIGEIVELFDKDNTTIYLISDHGFGGLHYNLYLNNWLLKNGYLKLKNTLFTLFKRLLFGMGITPMNIYMILTHLGLINIGLKMDKGSRYNLVNKFFLSAKDIDWKRTIAYSHGNIGQIYINKINREPLGIISDEEYGNVVSELIEKLRNEKFNNDPLFDRIFRKQDIYTGSKVDQAPDIVLFPHKFEIMAIGVSEFVSNKIIEKAQAFTGSHRMEGILIACGNGINKGKQINNAFLLDMAPTILYNLDIAIPSDMDGKVILDLFAENFQVKTKIEKQDVKQTAGQKDSNYSDEDEEAIKARLKSLGYIN